MRPFVIAALLVAGCGKESGINENIPVDAADGDTQRPGDPAKGYDYLINGGYITCGLPKSLPIPGNAADRMPGRSPENATLPYYWSVATSQEGVKVVSTNCLLCHASRINGQIVVGLGAHDRDFTQDQVATIELAGGLISNSADRMEFDRFLARMRAIRPYSMTKTIGANPADSFTAVLMAHRDPVTLAWSSTPLLPLPPPVVVPVDVPPWWRMSKKQSMFYNAAGRGDHARIMMAAALLCSENVAEAERIDAEFVNVRAWIETALQPPKWPFPVDMNLATSGQAVFETQCASCHGTYGEAATYPNTIVAAADVGTDPLLVQGETEFGARFVEWFGKSFWGQTSRFEPQPGYIAPPLDGIWATAPFLHNGSIPTLEALLDSSKRPTYWTRSFSSTDYDQAAVGWIHQVVDHGQAAETDAAKRVRIYDTTLLGYSNSGHTYGDTLSADDRRALLEYLKTL